jgi:hypothetical protein
MGKLIREEPAGKFSSECKYWLIGNRFELVIYMEKDFCTFFVDDMSHEIHSLKLTPKMGEDLRLFENLDVKMIPSIDTCGIVTPRSRYEEIFTLIENYLLKLEMKGEF